MKVGRFFNLDRELRIVRDTWFPGMEARIRWGNESSPRRRKRRSIRFASWHEEQRMIRVHPALDRDWVPVEFIRYLIYHELCHGVEKPVRSRDGNRIHHPGFKALERQYPEVDRMSRLGKEIFQRLIREGR